jgi:hypothetical protein
MLGVTLSLFLIVSIFIGCSDQLSPTGVEQTLNIENIDGKPLAKVGVGTAHYTQTLYYDDINCGTGDPAMELSGQIEIIQTLKTLPNETMKITSKSDYFYPGNEPLTLTDLVNGDVYHITHGNNPRGQFISEGFQIAQQHYSYTEHFATDDGKKLILHGSGAWHITNNGKVNMKRSIKFCR